MIKTISIDMSTCDEDFENRIFGKVIDQEGNNLICEFDSANYDFKQEKVIKQLKEKLNITIDALKWIEEQADTSTQYDYEPEVILKNIVKSCQEILENIKEIKNDI